MKGNPDPPLTGPEIYLGEPVKLEVAELILREGTLYLQDMLAAKIQYEQKAAVLLAAYITLAVGLAGAALLTRDSLHGFTVGTLLVCGCTFGFSALCCMWALRDRKYGAPGINPRDWLTAFWLRSPSPDATVAKATAMMAEELQEDIRLSIKGNDSKADAISTSLVFAGVASFATMVVAGWELWGSR